MSGHQPAIALFRHDTDLVEGSARPREQEIAGIYGIAGQLSRLIWKHMVKVFQPQTCWPNITDIQHRDAGFCKL